MTSTSRERLWILIEGHTESNLLTFNLTPRDYLSDLRPVLIHQLHELANVSVFDLQILKYDNRTKCLPSNTTLDVLWRDTSASKPLVVRYPLSGNTVVVNVRFDYRTTKFRLPHTPGVWYMLLAKIQVEYERLQKDENKFYLVDQETEAEIIEEEFTFNGLVKETKPSDEKITINLVISIKGKGKDESWGWVW